MPEGAKNWELDEGITEVAPAIEQVGTAATVSTMSDFSVQPLA